VTTPKDPFKYFRIEARELLDGLKQGALDLEKGGGAEGVARLLRLAHTLKGAARVVKLPAIAEHAHAVEDALEPYRDGAPPPRERIDELFALLDAIAAELSTIARAPAPPEGAAAPAPAPDAIETVRVEIVEMDRLLESVSEASVRLQTLRNELATLERAHRVASMLADQLDRGASEITPSQRRALGQLRADLGEVRRRVESSVGRAGAELGQVREAANRLRLLPVSTLFGTLERAARDAARALGKRVVFSAHGGDTRLDAQVLTPLADALLHVVRNAVAHGIEAPAERRAAGKPLDGTVAVRVERRGAKVVFSCTDDGRGVDVDGLRRAAVERGLGAAAREEDVLALLVRGGLTTMSEVTEVSGRGIGLDVVRAVVERLKGTVRVESAPRAGTTFEICVPVSMAAMLSLTVRAGEVASSLPLDAVRATLRVTDAEIARDAEGEALRYEGNVIPFAPLARVLRGREDAPRAAWSAVVVQAGGALAAIGVDRLVGTGEVLVRALPSHARADSVVAGASLDADGNPEIVLDPEALVERARTQRRPIAAPTAARPPLLVIDDSLTTRMLEQSILESAGYEVELATSAEEALEKAKAKRYGVFVVDVEMPGMDGFEFVERTRADPALREVPAILVTSRSSDADRKRGAAAGAHAYVVKGEFDQTLLLDSIRRLVG